MSLAGGALILALVVATGLLSLLWTPHPYAEQDLEEFATAMGSWPPFPDTHQALLELQKLTKTVLITNTDDEIIAQTQRSIGVTFDEIIPTHHRDTCKIGLRGNG